MKKYVSLIVLCLAILPLSACNKDKAPTAQPQPTDHAAPAQSSTAASAPEKGSGVSGTVTETMNAKGYTYVQVDNGTQKIWAAAPQFQVAVGDSVVVPEGMAMHDFHSEGLNRDFKVVYFVESVLNASNPMPTTENAQAMPPGHPQINAAEPAVEIDLSNVAKADGGQTIADVYTDKANLSGKTVTLRGKVVKYNPQIMGKNWIHIQDGSGDSANGSNDLTINTAATAKLGDTVLVTGILTLDKDFGYGYRYDLIIEDAQVTVE